MDPEQYHRTLARINRYYQDGETSTYMQLLESVVGCVSLYSLYCCYDGSLVRQMRQMDDFIESENKLIYVQRGLLIVNPLYNGNRYVRRSFSFTFLFLMAAYIPLHFSFNLCSFVKERSWYSNQDYYYYLHVLLLSLIIIIIVIIIITILIRSGDISHCMRPYSILPYPACRGDCVS